MQTCLKYYFDTPDQLWSSTQGILYTHMYKKEWHFFRRPGVVLRGVAYQPSSSETVMNLSRLAASMPLAMTNMGNALAMALARPGTTWKLVNLAVNQLVSPVQQTWHQNLWKSWNNLFPTFCRRCLLVLFLFWRHTVVSPKFSIKNFSPAQKHVQVGGLDSVWKIWATAERSSESA